MSRQVGRGVRRKRKKKKNIGTKEMRKESEEGVDKMKTKEEAENMV